MDVLVHIENVTKIYSHAPKPIEALKGISFSIMHGEVISLLGVNGAGKTTLSSILAALHPATSGSILYRGQSIYNNIFAYRRILGFCPQRPNFDRYLTVQENLLFAGRYFLMPEVLIKQRMNELMEHFELTRYADSSATILSGGYRQRLLLARALMHKPEIVILDEPTVALDPHIRRQIWDIITGLKQQGVTIILTTHYIDEAEQLSDRVCILDRGTVRLIDKPENLMSTYNKERLEDVFLQLMEENTAQEKPVEKKEQL